jgi:Zn-dependent protease with chaperone function
VFLLVRASPLGPNAISLPNGFIVVTDDLVRLMQTPDNQLNTAGKARLLAVIGHEVGHLERRHVGRALVGSSLTAALSATLFGDFSAVAASVPTLLTNLAYSRDMEREADDYAVQVLRRNGMGPEVMADALAALEHPQRRLPKDPWLLVNTKNYLSTHPATAERIARLRAAPVK